MARLKHRHETPTTTISSVGDHLLEVVDTEERAARLDRYAERIKALGAAGMWTDEQVREELENVAAMDDFVKNDNDAAKRSVNGEKDTAMRKVSRFFLGR